MANKRKDKDLIFGVRSVIEAIKSGKDFDKIQIQRGNQSALVKELLSVANTHQVPVQFVPQEKFRIYQGKNHQGVIAVLSPITYQKIENIIPTIYEEGENPFILILDEISDVRNFGAIIRTAECSGVHAVIIPDKGSAAITGDAIKTSAGALFKVPVCRVRSLLQTIDFLKTSGLKIISASEKTEANYTSVDFNVPLALIMGSEEKGVSPKILKTSDAIVKIPILGTIESLNVSVAAGILLYEAVRQKTGNTGN
jgi:23S rRNA (guanosine2251-2'-O)-methyltransferase